MPELPDVEVFRRYLESTALHQTIDGVHAERLEDLGGLSRQRLTAALHGRRIDRTDRHGKFLFAGLNDGEWLVLHFGMTGALAYYKNDDAAPPHVRLRLDFDNGYRLAFDCQRLIGRIDLTEKVESFVEAEELGPDALSIEEEDFEQMLERKRGSIKGALMDQSAIAGLGNVYVDEILYQAGVHPEKRVDEIAAEDRKNLYPVMQRVLEQAIERRADAERYPESWLTPRRDEGAPCPRCGGRIEKIEVIGRTTYFCPQCQQA